MIDILKYLLPDQVWALENHLETSDGIPVYTVLGVGEFWDIKNKAGFPWDRFTFDEVTVFQSLTENDLVSAATAFKMNLANAGKGIAWGPRYYTPGESNPIFSKSSYRRYATCGQFVPQDLGGPSVSWFEGPYSKDFGGDLGKHMALKQVYLWSPNFANMERNWYVQGFGRCQWEKWVGGALKQTSAYSQIKTGGVPVLNFPCGKVTL